MNVYSSCHHMLTILHAVCMCLKSIWSLAKVKVGISKAGYRYHESYTVADLGTKDMRGHARGQPTLVSLSLYSYRRHMPS